MEGELGLVVDVDLDGVGGREHARNGADLLGDGGGEEHDLLVVGGLLEDLLDGAAHVDLLEERVALVEDNALDVANVEVLLLDQLLDATGGADHDVRHHGLEHVLVLLDGDAAEVDMDFDLGHVLGEAHELTADLIRELARVAHHQGVDLAVLGLDQLQRREHKHGRLAGAGLSLADEVVAVERLETKQNTKRAVRKDRDFKM